MTVYNIYYKCYSERCYKEVDLYNNKSYYIVSMKYLHDVSVHLYTMSLEWSVTKCWLATSYSTQF